VARPHVFCAGQITGVEGYVESAASGHVAARRVLARLRGETFAPPPAATALGALLRHVSGEAHPPDYDYQPTNVVFALFPPLAERHKKSERKARMLARARRELAAWAASSAVPLAAAPETAPAELRA
jgi:methylenetetrahydrofolate--tRNA-(uracil-5-)-methyltransferase